MPTLHGRRVTRSPRRLVRVRVPPTGINVIPVSAVTVDEGRDGIRDDAAVAAGRARRRYWKQRAWSSRVLHRLGELASHAGSGLMVAAVVVGWLIIGVAIGFPTWWENALYVTSSLITLIMVFAVQHTQARQSAATQRKLDELLRALPSADNQLIALEEVSEQQLRALNHRNIIDRENASGRSRELRAPGRQA